MEIVDLAAPLQLPADDVGQNGPVVLQDIGLHRLTAHGGLLDGGHVPDAGQGHVQGAGNWGGGQGKHIHLPGQLLELFLVGDAEALLLIHHQQAQIFKLYVLLQQPVCADEHIHPSVGQAAQGVLCLNRGAETADGVDADGVTLKPAYGGEIMLPGQHGGGYQDGGLLAVQHALHNSPEGYLGLAIAHVAA
ncbi:hypothetical protein SDC9_153524 [bioreactor metagenome]|uniref:Uncharacterized protein n=1 Tax=bioreactor metagenome TaxID=1076179 RepID=A0A645EW52_9ZZZZ